MEFSVFRFGRLKDAIDGIRDVIVWDGGFQAIR